MKKITFVITEDMYNMLGLQPNNATEEATALAVTNALKKAQKADELQAKVDNLTTKNTELQNSIDAKTKENNKKSVDNLLTAALTACKITNELKSVYEKQYENNPEGLEEVLNVMRPYKPVNESLNTDEDKGQRDMTKKGLVAAYDKHFEAGTLSDVKNADKDYFVQMFKAKHGREPKD